MTATLDRAGVAQMKSAAEEARGRERVPAITPAQERSLTRHQPPAPLPSCSSCGKPASVIRWSAAGPRLGAPEVFCGRCALCVHGDTLGTIATVLLDLGAADA